MAWMGLPEGSGVTGAAGCHCSTGKVLKGQVSLILSVLFLDRTLCHAPNTALPTAGAGTQHLGSAWTLPLPGSPWTLPLPCHPYPLIRLGPGSRRHLLTSSSALATGSRRTSAASTTPGGCNVPAGSWSWLKDRDKQLERPGFHSGKASLPFVNHPRKAQKITSEHPIHPASNLRSSWRVNIDISRAAGPPCTACSTPGSESGC